MKLRVLGCSGGIGAGLKTTSFYLDDDVLVDAGSGVGDLYLEEMAHIRHIFLTHSHLDHISFIPFLIDSIFERITDPITVHAQPETIKALQDHIFNWKIWPDFSQLPDPSRAVLRFESMTPGETVQIDGREFEMIPVNHSVPGVGYRISNDTGSFAFSGDTASNDTFWDALNKHDSLDLLIVEAAFANRQANLAQISHHYCPATLAQDLQKLRLRPKIYLSHLKPGEEIAILSEVKRAITHFKVNTLIGDEVFNF